MSQSGIKPICARTVSLQKYVTGADDLANLPGDIFAVTDIPLPNPIPEDSLLLQTLCISNDPAQAIWITKHDLDDQDRKDMSTLSLGTPMGAFVLSRVVGVGGNGTNEGVKVGDIVEARAYWADYTVVKKSKVTNIK